MKSRKHFFSLLLLCLLAVVTRGAQGSVEGHWQGALLREGTVQVIRIDFFTEGGTLKARVDTPDLVAAEPPPVSATFENSKLQFEMALGKATLMVDAAMGEMMGSIGEATPPLRIHLKRAYKPFEVPVRTEEVQFRNGEVTLSGTVVTPASQTPGPYPAVLWIHGRSRAGRNGFRGYARILAQQGIASLIYDKRGAGTSTGDHDKSGMYDFAGDALAGLEFLANRSDIDRRRIGLHGTSAGGWVAAIVATRTKTPLAFIITNVGPADSVRDQQLHVAEYSMRQSGIDFTPAEYAAAAAHMGLVLDFAYTNKGWEALQASVVKAKQTRWARFVDLPESQSYEDIAWVRLNQYDPGPDLKKITVPFLALYGGSDYVVPPEENVKKLERYLTEAGNRDFKVITFPGADHSLAIPGQLRRVGSDQPERYYWLWRKRAPGVIETTVDWLLEHVKPKGGS